MAWWDSFTNDNYDDNDWMPPSYFTEAEISAFDGLIDNYADLADDEHAQALFHVAMYDMDITPLERDMAFEQMREYLSDTYGMDFMDEFDWENYRESYDSVS